MSNQIPESDWKVYKNLFPIAMDRFCQRVLEEIESIGSDNARGAHERYLDIYKLIKERDKALARTFDEFRRSSALIQLLSMVTQDLVTEEEMGQFSEETRDYVKTFLQIRDV